MWWRISLYLLMNICCGHFYSRLLFVAFLSRSLFFGYWSSTSLLAPSSVSVIQVSPYPALFPRQSAFALSGSSNQVAFHFQELGSQFSLFLWPFPFTNNRHNSTVHLKVYSYTLSSLSPSQNRSSQPPTMFKPLQYVNDKTTLLLWATIAAPLAVADGRSHGLLLLGPK